MPNSSSKLRTINISNPSDNVLSFIAAACMSVLGYKFSISETVYFSIVQVPRDILSVCCEIYLIFYFMLIASKSIGNLFIILQMNSPKYRRDLLSAIAASKTEHLSIENFQDRISPLTRHLTLEKVKTGDGEVTGIEIQPIEAAAFFVSMKRFKITMEVTDGIIRDYKKEGFF